MITCDDVRGVPFFADLDDQQCTRVASHAADIRLNQDEWVAREGEAGAFFVLLSGRVAIMKSVGGVQKTLITREPGEYFGELPLLLDTPFFASGLALEPSRLLRLSASDFLWLVTQVPSIRKMMSDTLFERVQGVEDALIETRRVPLIIGNELEIECHNIRDFLNRNMMEYEWLNPENELDRLAIPPAVRDQTTYPIVLTPDDAVLVSPTLREVAGHLGLQITPKLARYDVVVIGGGPSGLASAVYGASEGLQVLMIEETAPGGQAGTSSRIENYLGFPIGISGDDLGMRALHQAQRFGAEILVTRRVTAIVPGPEYHQVRLDDDSTIETRAIVLATGVSYRRLTTPGLDALTGAGVYYGAARTEAIGMRGRTIYLIGGGNSAGQAAMYFANYAEHVTILVRAKDLAASMSQYLIDQLATRENIAIRTQAEVVAVQGKTHLESLTIHDRSNDTDTVVPADGLFIFIGADASTDWLPKDIAVEAHGYILTGRDLPPAAWSHESCGRDPFLLETSVARIFAVGDVRCGSLKRVASAVGEGSMAIAFVHQALAASVS